MERIPDSIRKLAKCRTHHRAETAKSTLVQSGEFDVFVAPEHDSSADEDVLARELIRQRWARRRRAVLEAGVSLSAVLCEAAISARAWNYYLSGTKTPSEQVAMRFDAALVRLREMRLEAMG